MGQYEHTIDEKGRLAIPARFRAELVEGLYLTAGVDRCLQVLTPQAWQATASKIASLPWPNADARQVQRNIFALATHLVPDKLGRIVIPHYLRSHAQLGGDVVVVGVWDRIEIWDVSAWAQVRGEFLERGVDQVQSLAALWQAPGGAA